MGVYGRYLGFCIMGCNTNLRYPRNIAKSYHPGMVKILELHPQLPPLLNYAIMGYCDILYCKYIPIPGVCYGLTDFVSSRTDM